MAFKYVSPAEMWSYNATAATLGGTVDSDYSIAWLTDTRPSRPVRMTGTSLSASITFASGEVGVVAVVNHNLTANVTISGGVSGTITPATLPPNSIPLNVYKEVTPTTTTTVTMAVTGNAASVIVGGLLAGKLRTMTSPNYNGIEFIDDDFVLPQGGEFMSIPPYDRGMERRRLTGHQLYSTADLALLRAWRQAEKAGTLPSLIIPDSDVNDCWLVQFRPMRYRPVRSDLWEVDLDFLEYPRLRW